MVTIKTFTELSSLAGIRQWGYSRYGHVAFPIPFTSFYQLVLLHVGGKFAQAKALNLTALDGFTLSVKDLNSSNVDADSTYDAHYIAIGK